jgi:hypothetical protein
MDGHPFERCKQGKCTQDQQNSEWENARSGDWSAQSRRVVDGRGVAFRLQVGRPMMVIRVRREKYTTFIVYAYRRGGQLRAPVPDSA